MSNNKKIWLNRTLNKFGETELSEHFRMCAIFNRDLEQDHELSASRFFFFLHIFSRVALILFILLFVQFRLWIVWLLFKMRKMRESNSNGEIYSLHVRYAQGTRPVETQLLSSSSSFYSKIIFFFRTASMKSEWWICEQYSLLYHESMNFSRLFSFLFFMINMIDDITSWDCFAK